MIALIPWLRREDPLALLRHEVDDVLGRFFGAVPGDGAATVPVWAPRIDVEETDKEILVKVDLPGVDPKDVEVSVAEGSLILKGEKKEVKEEKGKNYRRMERFTGNFYREIPLPPAAVPDKIVAETAKGVVTVTIPKKPEMQVRRIPVRPNP